MERTADIAEVQAQQEGPAAIKEIRESKSRSGPESQERDIENSNWRAPKPRSNRDAGSKQDEVKWLRWR